MTPEEFVRAVKFRASDASVRVTLSNLRNPPGRLPGERQVRLSQWFAGLKDNDRESVEQVIRDASQTAVFGFFAILDGVRVVEEGRDKGEFELYFVKGGQRTLLNPHPGEELHDIYKWLIQKG